jgi:hypothetical protein
MEMRFHPDPVDRALQPRETRPMQTPDEERELTDVIDRLMKKFPAASRDEVEGAVTAEHEALDGHRLRDFVPVLVEKQAKKRLRKSYPKKKEGD